MSHLFIDECKLPPGGEWAASEAAWKIVLVREGILYWLGASPVRELGAGEVLVLNPAGACLLRASQLGPAVLHLFHFQPEHLVGLLSISERLSLERLASHAEPRHIPASDAIAREFAEIVASNSQRRSFFHRCRILNLVAMIFRDAAPQLPPAKTHLSSTLLRFEEVISRIPDSELVNCPSERLAEMCGCSVRHFRRVFRKHFKTSVRAKQTELRLEKARQLLVETEDKIVNIAFESGYRHPGFFNALFKKRFGVTPSEWRRLHSGTKPPAKTQDRAAA